MRSRLKVDLPMGKFDQKFLFVTGKGGVGKSTVAVALSRHLAKNGRRVLLAGTDAAPLARLLGGDPPTKEISVQLGASASGELSTVLIEPEAAIREYGELILRSSLAVSAVFDNRYSRSFLRAVPGLHQWAVLGKAWFHAVEEVDGRPRFDSVVFDAPATGHGLEMLRVPKVIRDAAPPGPLRRDAEAAWQMLQDPAQAGVALVTLPEELPISESLTLQDELSKLGLTVAATVLNAKLTPAFPSGEGDASSGLAELERRIPDEVVDKVAGEVAFEAKREARRVLEIAWRRLEQEALQSTQQRRLAEHTTAPLIVLPWLHELPSAEGAARLAEAFD